VAAVLCTAIPIKEKHARFRARNAVGVWPDNCAAAVPTKGEWQAITEKVLLTTRGSTNGEVLEVDEILSANDNQVYTASYMSAMANWFAWKCANALQAVKDKAKTRCAAFVQLGTCATQRLTAANTALGANPKSFLDATPVKIMEAAMTHGTEKITYTAVTHQKIGGTVKPCGALLDQKCEEWGAAKMKLHQWTHSAANYVKLVNNFDANDISKLVRLVTEGGAMIQASPIAGGVQAAYLPFIEGVCTFMILPDASVAAFTSSLSGCFLFVATKANTAPLFIHANANPDQAPYCRDDAAACKNTCADQIFSLYSGQGYAKSKKLTPDQYGATGSSVITPYGTKGGDGTWTWSSVKTTKADRGTQQVVSRHAFVDWT